VITCKVFPDE
jgi:acyl CoA:acetate/3-ketoacid CoA transferase